MAGNTFVYVILSQYSFVKQSSMYGTVEESFEDYSNSDGWTSDNKKDALAYLKLIESFEFMYVLVTLQCSLLYIKEASVKLQGK